MSSKVIISLIVQDTLKGLCNNYLEGGGGAYEKMTTREGGLDVKFYTYGGGALLYHSILQTAANCRVIRVQI